MADDIGDPLKAYRPVATGRLVNKETERSRLDAQIRATQDAVANCGNPKKERELRMLLDRLLAVRKALGEEP